jgi:hypothetical protein
VRSTTDVSQGEDLIIQLGQGHIRVTVSGVSDASPSFSE